MKTHKVVDLTCLEEEGQDVFAGTERECHEFVEQQGGFGYQVVPLSEHEWTTLN